MQKSIIFIICIVLGLAAQDQTLRFPFLKKKLGHKELSNLHQDYLRQGRLKEMEAYNRYKEETRQKRERQSTILENRICDDIQQSRIKSIPLRLSRALKANAIPNDSLEPNNTFASAFPVTVPETLSLILTLNDTDFFKVAADSGQVIDLEYITDYMYASMSVFSDSGNMVDYNSGSSRIRDQYPVTVSGTYYIRIVHRGSGEGPYILSINTPDVYRVSGTISTADNKPLPRMLAIDILDSKKDFIREIDLSTDSSLSYAYEIFLPSGTYYLRMDEPYNSNYTYQYFNNRLMAADADPVVVAGEVSGIDFVLIPGARLSGWVVDAQGRSLQGIRVTARDVGVTDVYLSRGDYTDSNGYYEILQLTHGDYIVYTSSDTFAVQYYNLKSVDETPDTLTVVAGQIITDINFRLDRGGIISGRVTDKQGNPLRYVNISVDGGAVWEWGHTDSTGYYEVTGLSSGNYIVYASGDSFMTLYYNNKTSRSEADSLQVSVNSRIENINFVLSRGGTITGHVRDQYGNPVSGADISLRGPDQYKWAYTDTSGFYSKSGLAPGNYIVYYSGQIYMDQYYNQKSSRQEADSVTVIMDQTTPGIDFVLKIGGSVTGTISTADGGVLPNHLDIDLRDENFNYIRHGFVPQATLSDSVTYFITGIPTGRYTVALSIDQDSTNYIEEYYHDSYTQANATFFDVIEEEVVENIDFTLEQGGMITGAITTADNNNLPQDLTVYVLDQNQEIVQSDYIYFYMPEHPPAPTASYFIRGVPPGTFKVQAYVYPYAESNYISQYYQNSNTFDNALPVSVASGDTLNNIDFTLRIGGMITGTVLAEGTNAPIQSVLVVVLHENQGDLFDHFPKRLLNYTIPDSTGKYVIGGLVDGNYRVQVMSFDFGGEDYLPFPGYFRNEFYNDKTVYSLADVIPLQVGDTAENIDFSLKSSGFGTITGYLITENGDTVNDNDYIICAQDETGFTMGFGMTGTDTANGNTSGYLISGLPSGTYRVGALHEDFIENNATPTYIYHLSEDNLSDANPVLVFNGQTAPNVNIILKPGIKIQTPDEVLPVPTALYQNVPNPFNPSTVIGFSISRKDARTTQRGFIEICNIRGTLIKSFEFSCRGPGKYRILWMARDFSGSPVASGLYFVRLRMGSKQISKRMILLR